jgi:hypothetical protein
VFANSWSWTPHVRRLFSWSVFGAYQCFGWQNLVQGQNRKRPSDISWDKLQPPPSTATCASRKPINQSSIRTHQSASGGPAATRR